jgi:hypothetical protein
VLITTSKEVNLVQLDAELGGHGLVADFNDEANKKITPAEGSSVTETELAAAIDAHVAVFHEQTVAEKLASVGLSIDDLKVALGV